MSMKITVSYKEEFEAKLVEKLLEPISDAFKIKRSAEKEGFKHLYFLPKTTANKSL